MLLVPIAAALTLDQAWNAADTGSLDLALVHEQTVQVDALRTQAWSLVQPKLVLGANYTINERPIALLIDPRSSFTPESLAQMEQFGVEFTEPTAVVLQEKHYWDWNVSIVQPLFNGQAIPLLRAAYAQVDSQHAAAAAQRAQIRAGIARAYWGVVVAREAQTIAVNNLENAEAHRKLAEVTTAVGTAAPTVGLQAELGVARAQREVARAREQVVAAEEAFAKLTGLPADTPVERPPPRALPYDTFEAALSRAAERRPDIAAADNQARSARFQATASHLAWLPSVDGRFTQSWSENLGFTGEHYNWMLVFSANWVLWDGGYRIGAETIAASQSRQAALVADKARADAHERVRTAWEQHTRAGTAIDAVQREIALADEQLRLAEAAFGVGSLSYLEVEDARLGARASRLSELGEAMNRDLAAVDLLAATGDL